MNTRQFILNLSAELLIDSFAGGGGASTAIEMALRRHVDHAINHDAQALGMHRINHPQTVHHCEDVWAVDPQKVCAGRSVGYAHFSPDCTDFSKAKGGKPRRKKIRGLAWVILKWAGLVRPRVISLENVEEFQGWGPVLANGKRCPKRIGKTFRKFVGQLRKLGYVVEWRELRACDYGAPTIRKRLFLIARCDDKPIVWPKATHYATKAECREHGGKLWRSVSECIDWRLPCPSIFLSKEEARPWRCKRPLVTPTLRRIAKGIGRFVLHNAEPFLVSLTHQGGDRVESISEPMKTITGAERGEKALISPTLINAANTKTTGRGPNTWPATEPLRTITAAPGFALTEATLAPLITEHAQSGNQRTMPADEPLRTLCAGVKGGHFAVVTGSLVQTGYGEREGQEPRAMDVQQPLGTIVGTGKHAVVTGTLVNTCNGKFDDAPSRAVDPQQPLPTITGVQKHAFAAASLVKLRGDNIGSQVDEPMHTISAGGTHHGVVAAVLAQHNGGFNTVDARPVDQPISAITGTGSQQQVVAASLAAYFGTEKDGQAVTEPLRTVTTKARMAQVESTAVQPLTPEQEAGARRVASFLREHGVEFEGEFATVAGGWVIIDIGMRMLTPRELVRAQGFPDTYIIDKAWLINPANGNLHEVTLTKEQQIRMCGNSVSPPVLAALVSANVPELALPPEPKRRRHKPQAIDA